MSTVKTETEINPCNNSINITATIGLSLVAIALPSCVFVYNNLYGSGEDIFRCRKHMHTPTTESNVSYACTVRSAGTATLFLKQKK